MSFLPQIRESVVVELHAVDVHIGLLDQFVFPFAHGRVVGDELVQTLAEQDFFTGDCHCIGFEAPVYGRFGGVADEHGGEEPVQVHIPCER